MAAKSNKKERLDQAVRQHQAGQLEGAITIYKTLLKDRCDASVLALLGVALTQNGQLEEGLQHLRQASGVSPRDISILSNFGHALCLAQCFEEAERIYSQALEIDPRSDECFSRLFACCIENEQFGRVIEAARSRLKRDPEDVEAHTTLGLAHLTSGDYEHGWPEFEWRWKVGRYARERQRFFNRPLWDGSPLGKRALLLHAEMGVGDTVQMVRFLPWLINKHPDARFIFFVDAHLCDLLANTFAAYPSLQIEPMRMERITAQYDVHLPLMSLAGLFGVTLGNLENHCPYLTVEKTRSYGGGRDLIVGLSWYTSSPEDGVRRSIPLETFLPLCAIPRVRLIDLQYGDTTRERQAFTGKGGTILHDSAVDSLTSIKALAEQIKGCDLILTIDNSVVHVAGALGRPTWLLLHRAPNWRWLTGRTDSPWYPSVRLYRQDKTALWNPVIKRVRKDLQALASSM